MEFAASHVAPFAAQWELERRFPQDTLAEAGKAGLLGLMVSEDDGGRGLGLAGSAAVGEALAAADMGFAFSLKVHANFTASLARTATPGQRERYLPDMLAGRRLGAFLLTEPDVGSD